jgi:hypothetical protein
MTKKHFNALAAAVRDWRRVCPSVDEKDVAQLVARLAGVCQEHNPRFNRTRFFDACGVAIAAETRRKERAA